MQIQLVNWARSKEYFSISRPVKWSITNSANLNKPLLSTVNALTLQVDLMWQISTISLSNYSRPIHPPQSSIHTKLTHTTDMYRQDIQTAGGRLYTTLAAKTYKKTKNQPLLQVLIRSGVRPCIVINMCFSYLQQVILTLCLCKTRTISYSKQKKCLFQYSQLIKLALYLDYTFQIHKNYVHLWNPSLLH